MLRRIRLLRRSEAPRAVAWGFADQLLSSATNLFLFVLAGRVLGPDGLGIVFIGFSSYLAILGLQRALLTDPLVALTSAAPRSERVRATRSCLTWALMASSAGSVLLGTVGATTPGDIGRGLLLFAPCVLPALAQDFWRTVLFRDQRPRAATLNDGIWLAVMTASLPAAWLLQADWAVVACWGAGAVASAVAGFMQTRTWPWRPAAAWLWWRREAWPFGNWLAVNSVVYGLGSYATIFALATLLGTKALGGLRAVESVFAPLSLVAPALTLPGLPALARSLAASPREAQRLAGRLGATAAALSVVYVLSLGLGAGRLVPFIFGPSFSGFTAIVWPVGIAQVLTAASIGFGLLLKAQRRGRALLIAGSAGSAASLVLATALAWTVGLTGAAWGLAAGSAIGALALTAAARQGGGVDHVRDPRMPRARSGRLAGFARIVSQQPEHPGS